MVATEEHFCERVDSVIGTHRDHWPECVRVVVNGTRFRYSGVGRVSSAELSLHAQPLTEVESSTGVPAIARDRGQCSIRKTCALIASERITPGIVLRIQGECGACDDRCE